MIEWNYTINITNLHKSYISGKITAEFLGKTLASILKNSPYYTQTFLDFVEIVGDFEEMTRLDDIRDYNHILDTLYDFADDHNRIWIESEKEPDIISISPGLREKMEHYGIKENECPKETLAYLDNADEKEQISVLKLIGNDITPEANVRS